MKFDKPAGENPIDQLKVVGRPHDRIDGPLKTTGTARYAYEWHEEAPNAAYGYIVGSAIAKGRLTALDTDAAQKAPGVLAVITASNAGALGKGDKNTARLLGGPTIEHYHQAIALVVAETFEQARAAASLVQVAVHLGDSSFPVSAGSGGQWGANTSTSGVYAACMKLREMIASAVGFDPEQSQFADGKITNGTRSAALHEATAGGRLTAEESIEFGTLSKEYQQSTFAGHFVEVGVHSATGEVRVRRMLAVCAAGRILNPKTARSQVIGAMTMGMGAALMEELAVDDRLGYFVNHDMAGYEVPVHADIPKQEVIFLDDTDPISSPMKAKGVGELGLCGVSAAIANAVYNATGIRVRDYPITLDKLLDKLPDVV
ncbi:TPA: molybdopterin-dependent oxidoreductase [Escherichia coli]|nr:molybdopterin-dependent oxidoreductase [Escherichia coli]HAM0002453.1 molybdopterin-dependent oxidoreductase [Escherichia coli]HBD0312460.1 molybdopterin-dependent oxidoreductase [Escherichia coli]